MSSATSPQSPVARFKRGEKRQRYTFSFEPDTYEKIADAAYATRRSMSSFVELATLTYIKAEEEKSGPFPPRPKEEE